MSAALPDIRTYLDFRAFLGDWFQARKTLPDGYSHRRFAAAAGHSSPSLLTEVIAGRRNLTPRHLAGFARALGLEPVHQQRLEALCALSQAKTHDERWAAWEAVAGCPVLHAAKGALVDSVIHTADPLHGLLEALLRQGVPAEPAQLRHRLRLEVSEGRLQRTLERLERLAGTGPSDLPDGLLALAREERLRQSLDRVARAGARRQPRSGHTAELLVPASMEGVVRSEIEAFLAHLHDLCGATRSGAPQQLYQLSLQLVPVGRPGRTDRSDEETA